MTAPEQPMKPILFLRLVRILAIVLPQALLFLIIGGLFDLLGGWNHGDTALLVLLALVLVAPPLSAAVLLIESIRYRRAKRSGAPKPSLLLPAALLFLLFESLALDIFILSQVRMH